MKRFISACLMAFTVNYLSGCAVNQKEDVSKYQRVLGIAADQPLDLPDPKDQLTLKMALSLANAKNEQLSIAGENYLQSLIEIDRAFASFLPTIRFIPSYMRQEKSSFGDQNPMVSSLLPQKTLDAPITATIDTNPFKDISVMNASEFESRRQKAVLLDRKGVVLLDVAQTFYQVLQSELQVKILKNSVNVNKNRLHNLEVQKKAGAVTTVDVSGSSAHLASFQNLLIQAENDLVHGRSMLAVLLGVSDIKNSLSDSFKAPDIKTDKNKLLAIATRNRPEMEAAHEKVKGAVRLLKSAWAGYFPSVSLDLTHFLSRQSFPDDVKSTSVLKINLPLFSAGLTHADVRTAYSRLRQAKLAESYAVKKLNQDLTDILADIREDTIRIEQNRVQKNAAQKSRHKAELALKAGIGTELNLLVAGDNLLKNRLKLTESIYKRNLDYLRMKKVLGVLDTHPDAPLPEPE